MKDLLIAKINYALIGVPNLTKRRYYRDKIYKMRGRLKIEEMVDNLLEYNKDNYTGEETEILCPDCNSKIFKRDDGIMFCKTNGCYYIGVANNITEIIKEDIKL
jgi:hypothetical protein